MVKTSKDSFSDAYEVEDNVGFSCNGILFSIFNISPHIWHFSYRVAFI